MIQLLDIKTSKEKFTTELEGIRAEIAKERSVLASLKQQSSVTTPALDLVTRKKDTDTGDITRDHSISQIIGQVTFNCAWPTIIRIHFLQSFGEKYFLIKYVLCKYLWALWF